VSAKKPPRQTFAEIVAEVPAAAPAKEQYSYSIPRPWITVNGQRWDLHGNAGHEGKELHKLLRRHELLAFHDYMNERTPITPEHREEFWRQAVELMEDSENSDFVGYLYASADGDRCLVIYESC
jgi:hypothetical protein